MPTGVNQAIISMAKRRQVVLHFSVLKKQPWLKARLAPPSCVYVAWAITRQVSFAQH